MGIKPNVKVFETVSVSKTRLSKRFQLKKQGFRNGFIFKDMGFETVTVSKIMVSKRFQFQYMYFDNNTFLNSAYI